TRMGEQLVIDRRFRGFADIAHGGYVGGLLAGKLIDTTTVEVKLRGAVPMGRRLEVEDPDSDRVVLSESGDDSVLAEARRAELDVDVPSPVSLAEAEEASSSYPGFEGHLFPECFTCGPARAPGDGLRVFPAPVAGTEVVAAPWMPGASFADPAGSVATR